ncbi:hypothetical protein HUG20_08875 [Salicibibacter cibi]|uniref:Thiamine pyrophosphate enzyme TPP-binding domain-containing protein n=1 Tax=Salicibibacter cibi TaxID=2743001 RepID=A0A7T6ZAM8_9BACI|nr:thiamine pyrophosphate-dependent enzyme [Salicibibacter cibi]QQK79989.1 hypothetical protein HUG20_08875 [Salicibibacter cibi]
MPISKNHVNIGVNPNAFNRNLETLYLCRRSEGRRLFDDSGYGILRYLQEASYGERTSVDLKNPDFVMMAKSMGFESEKVGTRPAVNSKGDSGAG